MSNKLPPYTSDYEGEMPNVVNSDLDFVSEVAEGSVSKVGKHPIIAKSIVTAEIHTSEVLVDWEARNDKAITLPRPKGDELISISVDISGSTPIVQPGNIDAIYSDFMENISVSGNTITADLNPYFNNTHEKYYFIFEPIVPDSVKALLVSNAPDGSDTNEYYELITFNDNYSSVIPYVGICFYADWIEAIQTTYPDGNIPLHIRGYDTDDLQHADSSKYIASAEYTLHLTFKPSGPSES